MTVALYVNLTRENARKVTLDVIKELAELNVKILMPEEFSGDFSSKVIDFVPSADFIRMSDLLVSIGGDGTIIHSAHRAAAFDKPILGINAGNLGFLAGLEKEELHLLKALINDEYSVDRRMMLSIKYYEGESFVKEYICLNDVVVARGNSLRLCDVEVTSGGKRIFDYQADGLIVATPTGSTAYSLSAGGPVVDTAIESLILTPICNHSLFSRSMIFKADSVIELKVKNPDASLPLFSCDGEKGVLMSDDSRLLVTRSEKYAKIIRIKSDSFADILSHKLIERYHPKEEKYEKEQT